MFAAINAWTFPAGTGIDEMAQAAKAAGFEAIELVCGETGELTFETPESTCRELADRLAECSIRCVSLASAVFWKLNLGSRSAKERQRARERVIAMLERAAWLKAETVLVVAGVVAHYDTPTRLEVPYEDCLAFAFESLHELTPEADARGVAIAIENVWNRFLLSPVEMREFVDRLNSPWIGVYLDVGNVLAHGIPHDWIRTLSHRIRCVHVKDLRLTGPAGGQFCLPGDGDVDWPAVMASLHEVGYQGPLVFEGSGELAEIRRRMDHLLSLCP